MGTRDTALHLLDDQRRTPIAHAVGHWEAEEVPTDRLQVHLRVDHHTSAGNPCELLAAAAGRSLQAVARRTGQRIHDLDQEPRALR